MGLAAYPGSFDPPTVAHLAIARAALAVPGIDEVRLVLSEVALGKEDLDGRTPVAARRAVLDAATRAVPGLSAAVTSARLVAEIVAALGADAVVVGADKWAQVLDPAWYGSPAGRDAALARLPTVLLAPRAGARPLPSGARMVLLDVDPAHAEVSATRARAGEHHLMLPEARAAGHWTDDVP